MSTPERRRILVVDDNPSIHADFKKILGVREPVSSDLEAAKAAFFGTQSAPAATSDEYAIETALQGRDALEFVRRGVEAKDPFALAFVDVRMPPGWDGVETIARLWEADPDLQCVICTAFSDYSWEETLAKLGRTDRLLILKKPFDPIEVCQIASAMTEKWLGTRRERARMREVVESEQKARVYASTVETTNRALELSRRRAENASLEKMQVLLSLGRELRAPLLAILEYADLLHSACVADALRVDHAEQIRRRGDSLLQVISDMTDLASLEMGTLTLSRSSVSPLAVVQKAIAERSAQAREKGLELRMECPSRVPAHIETDGARVEQVLRQLLDNAIKFTNSGSVSVVVEFDTTRLESPTLSMRVVDTGPGLTPEQLGRLFAPCSAAGDATVRERGGAGLGLVLVRGLAQRLGGELTVESEVGRGSSFRFSIPAGDVSMAELVDHPRAPIPSAQSGVAVIAPPVTLEGARILVVEDVASTSKLFRAFLESAGAEVVVAEDGREGLDLVQEAELANRPFDVVIMDVQMPVMDGHTATRELRARGYTRPILAVTAHAMTSDREACLAAGCNDYASKPIGRRALVELCALHLGPGRQNVLDA